MNSFFKRILTACVAIAAALPSWAQLEPVKWSTEVKELEAGLYQIVFTAAVDGGWHIYDLGPYELGGPMATSFEFTPDASYSLEGGVYALAEAHREFDPIYEMEIGYYEGKAQFAQNVRCDGAASVAVTADWMACNDMNCVTGDNDFSIKVGAAEASAPASVDKPAADKAEVDVSAAGAVSSGGSLWGYILSAIGWALVALLTPCVFPMIPMTVSFFLKGSGSPAAGRFRALMYGLFIVLLYTVPIGLIILITWLVGGDVVTADIFNWLATHWLPNIIFFAVFMIFAASVFGAFEIVLPEKLVNDSDAKADKKGLAGIFFMALTLVLVSFSCTGPIVGSVLIQSTSGEFWTPIITMFAFSVVFALPFTLFALFPSWLKKLPKSGGWLNSVKVVLGFVELALGLKFLSVADQTYHWGLLDREVYLAIWIVVFTLLGLYLLGKLRFKYDSPTEHLSVGRLALAIAVFSFVVYMIPGMFGAPLKALSGYLPPMETQDFVISRESAAAAVSAEVQDADGMITIAHGLKAYDNIDDAVAAARRSGKRIFVDITGHGCVNCREMEARVWSDPEVLRMLREDFVILALYVDDKTKIPESEQILNDNGKPLKDVGRLNSYIALTRFKVNSQPNYFVLDSDGNILKGPRAYDLDIQGYINFLSE